MTIPNDEETKGRFKISCRKAPTKARHKHIYEPVILDYESESYWKSESFKDHFHYYGGSRCTTCGKLDVGLPKDCKIKEKWGDLFHYNRDYTKTNPDNLPVIKVKSLYDLTPLTIQGEEE